MHALPQQPGEAHQDHCQYRLCGETQRVSSVSIAKAMAPPAETPACFECRSYERAWCVLRSPHQFQYSGGKHAVNEHFQVSAADTGLFTHEYRAARHLVTDSAEQLPECGKRKLQCNEKRNVKTADPAIGCAEGGWPTAGKLHHRHHPTEPLYHKIAPRVLGEARARHRHG